MVDVVEWLRIRGGTNIMALSHYWGPPHDDVNTGPSPAVEQAE
jgi:hypothetical protein